MRVTRIIFVTGTDTGVGKTVFAVSLLHALRSAGVRALGMKPFCSGTREDVEMLQAAQSGELSAEEVNPFYYREAVAPLVAQRQRHGQKVLLKDVLGKIRALQKRCDALVVEGSGGLLVPLGEGFTVADVIRSLKCEIVIVSRNKLGTINHTLLTARAVEKLHPRKVTVVLMEQGERDASSKTNFEILREWVRPVEVIRFPFLGGNRVDFRAIERSAKILKKVLATFFK